MKMKNNYTEKTFIVEDINNQYSQCVPNSFFWTNIDMLIHNIKSFDDTITSPIVNPLAKKLLKYFRIGLINTKTEGYDLINFKKKLNEIMPTETQINEFYAKSNSDHLSYVNSLHRQGAIYLRNQIISNLNNNIDVNKPPIDNLINAILK
jgi:hypothetical protein